MQRSPDPVVIVGAALLVLGLLEKRQHIIIAPALAALLTPAVIIGRSAAHVDHAVDRTGAAKDLAARLVEDATVELRLRFAVEHPVDPRVGKRPGVAEWDVNPRIAVLDPGFEQEDAIFPGFAQPSGHRTAGGAGTGNDEVVSFDCIGHDRAPNPASSGGAR